MPLCGVAFKSKDRCYGVECVSDDSCETVTTERGDTAVEISHVRAGKRPGEDRGFSYHAPNWSVAYFG